MDTIKVARVDNVVLEHYTPPIRKDAPPAKVRKTGTIHLTPHHLIFHQNETSASAETTLLSSASSSSQHTSGEPTDKEEIWIPYPSITLLTKLPQSIQGYYPLRIETKYFQNYVFLFEKDQERSLSSTEKEKGKGKSRGGSEDVWQSIKDSAVKSSVDQLHAFFYTHSSSSSSSSNTNTNATTSTSTSTNTNGWSIYNPRAEFTRQGLGVKTKSWRFTDINKDYSFSATYPNKMVIPTKISDSTLSYASKYRSKARIPVLSYLHWANNASITRSSQPMVGLKNSRSAQDERLVECIFSTHHYPDTAFGTPIYGATSTNLIIDARPTANAMANVAMGAGTENMENYKLGKKAYLGIDNIHVMRNSLKIITEAIREAETKPSGVLDRGLLRKSNWLKHLSTILDGSLMIIKNIHLNASHVLIHCSDGWDRTGQLSAISQICLDPYYRTIEGFAVLVEKDFLSFGHKFMDRSNHLSSEKYFVQSPENDIDSEDEENDEFNPGAGAAAATKAAQAFFASVSNKFNNSTQSSSHLKEISPVFHQFLDCAYQILRQFPNRFEYNEDFLLDIYYHLYSCQFGTFLFNNEKQKSENTSRTTSLWDYTNSELNKSKYVNDEYNPGLDKSGSDQGVLLYDPKEVRFWFRLFRRGDEEMNGSPISANIQNQSQAQAQGVSSTGLIDNASQDPVIRAISPPQSRPQHQHQTHTSINRISSPPLSGSSSNANPTSIPASISTSTSTSTSWNWQQFSSGALNAVSQAGRQIKNISADAYNQIKAEAGEVDDPWRKHDLQAQAQTQAQGARSGELNGSTSTSIDGPIGTGERKDYKPYMPRTGFRIPSETNPWSSGHDAGSGSGSGLGTGSGSSSHTNTNTNATKSQASRVNSNPWSTGVEQQPSIQPSTTLAPALPENNRNAGARTPSPSLSGLSLSDPHPHAQPKTANPTSSSTTTKTTMEATEDEEMIRAAMGDDKKAWDPLGAL
ncbi:uncharacterized protein I303_100253 [Kwoniella dejecticola CBS 10117]|uniref:Myotubularin n=1 Tax=Kwoniella dejecticola CBS 10117 TaxID=1296121 RepID=A0A1A6AEI6_9TREE|nr:myotubularin [Kwoniella dejecticola CBS 10117]OBR88438.1 myotubularin [Kwoniella dejecticola CBS 10117]